MKTLLLLRHAKSDWDAESDDDHERPLNKKGKRGAKRMGSYLAAIGSVPDRVVSSSAARAVSTVELAAEAGGWNCEIVVAEGLYQADPQSILALIQQQPEQSGRLLLAGHEPTFSQTASLLIGGGDLRMSTGAIACIEFAVDRWGDLRAAGGRLAWLVGPKQVEPAE